MILGDFLSRQLGDKSDPHQIVPISFNIKEVFKRNYQDNAEATIMVQTRSQSKGVKAPMVERSPNSTNRKEREVKPIIIDDIQTAPIQQKLISSLVAQMPKFTPNIHKVKPIHNQL